MNNIIPVRASSFATLFDCAHRWEGQQLLGKKLPSSPRAALGTAIHASTAVFDQARIDGIGMTADDAADTFIDNITKAKPDIAWSKGDLSFKDALGIGLTLHSRYCHEISPMFEFEAVEMTATPMVIDCGNGVSIELRGSLDRSRVKRASNGVGISDLKTGSMAVSDGIAKTKPHRPQIGVYEMLYEHTTGIECTEPADIIALKTSGKLDTAIGQIHGAKDLLIGTETDIGLLEFAAAMFKTGLFPPNPSSPLCSEKYCPRWATCKYH